MKIEIRPVDRKTWHGKKGKESFKRPTILTALVNTRTLTYDTGLSPEQEEKYGKELGVDLHNKWNREIPHPFWDSRMGQIKLENNTMFFDTELPLDAVKISVLKASRFVANSRAELDNGLYPDAEFVIYDEKEEIEVRATKVATRRKATIDSASLSNSRKAQIVLLLAGKNVKDKSADTIEVELDKLIQTRAVEVLRYIKKDPEQISTEALVAEAIQKGVLQKRGHKIYYLDSVIGGDEVDVVDYMGKIENQDLKMRIMEQIK